MDDVIRAMDGTLLASVRDDLRLFLQLNPNQKFTIYSDYCLDDKRKPNKVASFTIAPMIEKSMNILPSSMRSPPTT
jgi:hypothetical protein